MGFLLPPNKTHFYEMLELCKAYNPHYDVPINLLEKDSLDEF